LSPMKTLTREDVLKIIHSIRVLMAEKKEELIEIDSVMGDGDLGLTMTKGFDSADDQLAQTDETDIGKILVKTGMTIAKTAPSTMGTLIATGFMRGGKALIGKEQIDTRDLAAFFQAFVEGLMDRGKAQPGDKTVIDSIKPAADSLQAAADRDLEEALSEALEAAKGGLEATKQMVAKHGRVAYYKEKSLGKADPGATAGVFIVQGFARL
jgi:dihydroxyacetone kinase-like protein